MLRQKEKREKHINEKWKLRCEENLHEKGWTGVEETDERIRGVCYDRKRKSIIKEWMSVV